MTKKEIGKYDDKKNYNIFNSKVIWDFNDYFVLSRQYDIKLPEIVQIDFNRNGVALPNNEVCQDFRVRFKGRFFDTDQSWFALPVRSMIDTPFIAENKRIYFKDIEIGETEELMLDTCESSYQRGPNLLNLNSSSRSNCGGCKACVHNYKNLYDETVIKDSLSLTTKEDLEKFFKAKNIDISKLTQIAVVTGLFGSEENVIKHMKLVNKIAKERGFNGELMYFGCEVNSQRGLDELAQIENFALVYALDNFTKRDTLLAKTKSLITIGDAKNTLDNAKARGIETTIAYISGIDPLFDLNEGFLMLKDSLTRFPIINIYQIQTQAQVSALDESAKNIDYYIKSRNIIEKIFLDTSLRPKRWENYRPLWYQTFADETLPSNSYGELEKIKTKVLK